MNPKTATIAAADIRERKSSLFFTAALLIKQNLNT
jgi:hypothetical protein